MCPNVPTTTLRTKPLRLVRSHETVEGVRHVQTCEFIFMVDVLFHFLFFVSGVFGSVTGFSYVVSRRCVLPFALLQHKRLRPFASGPQRRQLW